MDLSRALERFATTPILYLDPVTGDWEDTGLCGSLQVYDRFITDRAFGQKKRVLNLPAGDPLPEEYGNFCLEGGAANYILESLNEDVRNGEAYGYSYLLRVASVEAQVIADVTEELSSGASAITGEEVIETHWIDVERYRSENSKTFDDVEYTTSTLSLPGIATVDVSHKIRLVESGDVYTVSEVFDSLKLTVVRGMLAGV
ncbi:MAG: hypothetical protein DRP70_17325 [Spirochaetes bacterium]|nr:MAG: hypothetical protein DRP70_17325 [Spirochaetota bacterium]